MNMVDAEYFELELFDVEEMRKIVTDLCTPNWEQRLLMIADYIDLRLTWEFIVKFTCNSTPI